MIKRLIKYITCKHKDVEFIRNIYGDEILWISPRNKIYRSEFKCKDCGKIVWKEYLVPKGKKLSEEIIERVIKESIEERNGGVV